MRPAERRHLYRRKTGWYAVVRRHKKRLWRWFADAVYGGPDGALARAEEWRDRLLARLPPATQIRKRFAPNTTGVVGVQLAREWARSGRPAHRYRASWYEVDGRIRLRSYAVGKYGARRAKALAIAKRKREVARVLRERRHLQPGLAGRRGRRESAVQPSGR